jgi:FMN reductase
VPNVVAIAGSPSHPSRSYAVLDYARRTVEREGLGTSIINVRDLPPEDLIYGKFNSPYLKEANDLVVQANGVIIATPVYKAAYTGVLKAYLDLLPQNGLAGKIVLPIVTGGTIAHLLAIDYALKPVLSALGARHILAGLFVLDTQIKHYDETSVQLEEEIEQRLQSQLQEFVSALQGVKPELVGISLI